MVCGDGPCDIYCGPNSCRAVVVHGGSGPVSMTCSTAQSCLSATVYAGSGTFDLSCLAGDSCYSMKVYGGSAPLNILCSGYSIMGACQGMSVYGGSGPTNLTCVSSIQDSCGTLTMTQNNSTLTEYDQYGTYHSFTCSPGQWQCPATAYLPNACVSNPSGCWSADQNTLTSFYRGLVSTGTLTWLTTTDLCLNGATGVTCASGKVTSL